MTPPSPGAEIPEPAEAAWKSYWARTRRCPSTGPHADFLAGYEEGAAALRRRAEEAERDLSDAVDAFDRWASHAKNCEWLSSKGYSDHECDCGFRAEKLRLFALCNARAALTAKMEEGAP